MSRFLFAREIPLVAILLIVCASLFSCKTMTKVVTVEVEKPVYIHDTTDRVREVHDTTTIEKTTTIEVKGDTVFINTTEKEKTKTSEKDTVYQYVEKPVEVQVPVPVEVPVEVPAQLTKWQKFRLSAFWWLSAGLIGFILWKSRHLWLALFRR